MYTLKGTIKTDLIGLRFLEEHEVKSGYNVYILGSDMRYYPVIIVDDYNYKDEDTELCLTEAKYYHKKHELYINKFFH